VSCAWLRVAPVPLRAFHAARLMPGLAKPHPREEDAGAGPAELPGSEGDPIMATETSKTVSKSRRRNQPSRPSITLKLVQALAPTSRSVEKIAAAFGLDPVDYDGICETTKESIIRSAEALQPTLSETAMTIHMQRITGSFVSSAHGAAQFYQSRVSQARDLTSKLANDDRDEDREGIYGFESRAARFRQFAAEAALTASAVMAAAEGAVAAHLHVTGEEWKPFEPRDDNATVGRQAADAELAAFE
jgi:hypothetical protein